MIDYKIMKVKPYKPIGKRVKVKKLKPTKRQKLDNLIKLLF